MKEILSELSREAGVSPWGRRRPLATGVVADVAVSERQFMVLPGVGVLPVVRGTANEDIAVWATVDEPRRWFVLCRGVEWAKGVSAQILWEVDPDLDFGELWTMMRKGQSNPAGVRRPYLDVDFYDDRSEAEESLRVLTVMDARIARFVRDRTFPMLARTVTGRVESFDVTIAPVVGADEWMMRPVGWTPRRLKRVEAFGLRVYFPEGRPPVDHRGPVRVRVRLQGPKDRFVELDLLPPAGRVREIPTTEEFTLVHERTGRLLSRRGTRSRGLEVFATQEPDARWFVLVRGVDMPGGIHGEVVWEVDGDTDVGAVERQLRGRRREAEVIAEYLDMRFYRADPPTNMPLETAR